MSIFWLLRIIFIIIFFMLILINGHFLTNRQKYEHILNNRSLNIFFVALYNACCYLSAGLLPSDPNVVHPPLFFKSQLIIIGFQFLGVLNLILGFLLLIKTVLMRKTIGAEETEGGLITNGIYVYFRHPIYTGIFLISFAIALNSINLDGMLILPFIFLANLLQAKIEEKYDVGKIFKEEYEEYRKKTRMFGPLWLWLIILTIFVLLMMVSYFTYLPTLTDFILF